MGRIFNVAFELDERVFSPTGNSHFTQFLKLGVVGNVLHRVFKRQLRVSIGAGIKLLAA